jgi:hypothetical protein
LIARAQAQVAAGSDVQFVNARLEDAPLPDTQFQAVCSRSAIHRVDHGVSWRTIAGAIRDGGTVALLSDLGFQGARTAEDQNALRAGLNRVSSDLAGEWPIYRDLAAMLAGAAQRQDNVSEVWAWLSAENEALYQRLGRPIRASTVARLVTARRAARS